MSSGGGRHEAAAVVDSPHDIVTHNLRLCNFSKHATPGYQVLAAVEGHVGWFKLHGGDQPRLSMQQASIAPLGWRISSIGLVAKVVRCALDVLSPAYAQILSVALGEFVVQFVGRYLTEPPWPPYSKIF